MAQIHQRLMHAHVCPRSATGRQLFESNRALVNSDTSLLEPDAEELDLSTFNLGEDEPQSECTQEEVA